MNRSVVFFLLVLTIIIFNGCHKNDDNPVTPSSPSTWTRVSAGLPNTIFVSLFVKGSNLYAGSDSGAFLSTNNGINWKSISNGLPKGFIRSFIVKDANLFAGGDSGIYVSTNNGMSWVSANNGISPKCTYCMAISGNNIFAADGGVCLSTNSGNSWNTLNTGFTLGTEIFSVATNGTNIFAGGLYGAFLSTNNGSNWSTIDSGLAGSYVNVYSFAFLGSNVFAGLYGMGVYLSTNNGNSWSPMNTGLSNLWLGQLIVSGYNLFVGSSNGVYLSTNNGSIWTNMALPESAGSVGDRALAVNGSYLFVGTISGVWRYPI